MKKKIIIGLIILVLIIIMLFVIILVPPIKNNQYHKEIINNIYANTDLKDITYANKDNNYYIIKTSDNKVIVLDLNYEIVFTKDAVRKSNMPLVYKRNNLYYEEIVRKKDKITYNYYSTDEDTLVFSSVVGGH